MRGVQPEVVFKLRDNLLLSNIRCIAAMFSRPQATGHVEGGHAATVGNVHISVGVLEQQHDHLLVLVEQGGGEGGPAKRLPSIVHISSLGQA